MIILGLGHFIGSSCINIWLVRWLGLIERQWRSIFVLFGCKDYVIDIWIWVSRDTHVTTGSTSDESTLSLEVGSPLHSLTTSLSDTTGKWVFKRVRSLSNGSHRWKITECLMVMVLRWYLYHKSDKRKSWRDNCWPWTMYLSSFEKCGGNFSHLWVWRSSDHFKWYKFQLTSFNCFYEDICSYLDCVLLQREVKCMSCVEAFIVGIKIESSDQSPFWEPIKEWRSLPKLWTRTLGSNLTINP